MMMTALPVVPSLEAIARCAPDHTRAAMACQRPSPDGQSRIEYPFLGPPPPHQPNVCRFVGDGGAVCGVGGHSARTHAKPMSVAARALTQAVWLLENMELLDPREASRQIRAMFHVMCALELRRQERIAQGLHAATAEIKSILIMYNAVTEWFANVVVTITAPSSLRTVPRPHRAFRSTTHLLNDILPTLIERPAPLLENTLLADTQEHTCFVVFLFPFCHDLLLSRGDHATHTLRQMCLTAFAQQEASLARRMAEGHLPSCQEPTSTSSPTCACNPQDQARFIKVDRVDRGVRSCLRCGLAGHNRGSCRERNTATHVAVALATLLDPQKSPKIAPDIAHLSLYNCYQAIVALLYQWCFSSASQDLWRIDGVTQLRKVDCDHPELLLRLFNLTVTTLKSQPRFGENMLVVSRPDQLMVNAAHNYERIGRSLRPESVSLKQRTQEAMEEFQDEDLARPRATGVMTPAKRRTVQVMVQSSACANQRLAGELGSIDIGTRFAFEDLDF